MSSAFCSQTEPNGCVHSFKTSGMLLKLACIPEYASKLVVILDDTEGVWTDASEQALLYRIARQQCAASDAKPADKRALVMFGHVASRLHGKAYAALPAASSTQLRPLAEVLQEVAVADWRKHYPFRARRQC